jgi:Uri superfamily endonuclease
MCIGGRTRYEGQSMNRTTVGSGPLEIDYDLDTHSKSLTKGSYILILYLKQKAVIQVGKLGKFAFPKGFYAYIGSALGPGGLRVRLRHHLLQSSKQHWHIDYLRPFAPIKEVWVCQGEERYEHKWALALQNMDGASIPVSGFGSSDCNCPTHLFAFKKRPSIGKFKDGIQKQFVWSRLMKAGRP